MRGSGFLKHMVRNIAGALIEAGKGNLSEKEMRALLGTDPGDCWFATAPAKGLFLMDVEYPDHAR